MILNCNSCAKKFVVPDSAISKAGRMVQCGSCGNKWKQFPINQAENDIKTTSKSKIIKPIANKPKKTKKNTPKKTREINLYSPEYLAKKHGIKLDSQKTIFRKNLKTEEVYFGFYNFLILFIFLAISLSRILFFASDFIIETFPASEFYLNYFFESIRNLFEIWKSLITY